MYQNVLIRLLHAVVNAHFLDTPSFKVRTLVADCWMYVLAIIHPKII